MRISRIIVITGIYIVTNLPVLMAQEVEQDAAKEAQNPLGNVISLPFQNNNDFGVGAYGKTNHVVNIQPIIPFLIGKKGWLMMNRLIVPLPKSVADNSSENAQNIGGLGDISYTAWFAPPPKGSFTWGFGLTTILPTASKPELGDEKLSLGPSIVLVYATPKFVGAAVISDWKSVAGNEARADVHVFYFQYILTYFLPKKWYATSAPINLANWQAPNGQQWIIPLGAGIGKMFKIGNLPLDLNTHAYYNVVRPDGSAEWQFRVQLKFIFPKGKK